MAAGASLILFSNLDTPPSALLLEETNGTPFVALIIGDAQTQASFDYGVTPIVPADASTVVLVGYGQHLSTGAYNATLPGSPVWVTALSDTLLYVDYDGDPTTGSLTDPLGAQYDTTQSIGRLDAVRLYDTDGSRCSNATSRSPKRAKSRPAMRSRTW